MNTKHLLLVGALWTASLTTASAQVLISGNSMGDSHSGQVTSLNEIGYSYTYVAPSAFTSTSLSGYNTVWLDGFSQYGSGLTATLNNFLATGGTVLVQNPGFGTESLSAYPLGDTLSAIYTYPPGENLIRLVGNSPLNAGLTGNALSGWNPSAFGIFTTIGDFTQLSDNGNSAESITIATTVGSGHLIYTQQGLSQRITDVDDPAARTFLGNSFAAATVPEPGTMGLFALGAVGILMYRRRKA